MTGSLRAAASDGLPMNLVDIFGHDTMAIAEETCGREEVAERQ
jgi:hypothetical protein